MREENKQMRILSAIGMILVVAGHLGFNVFDVGGLFPYYSFHVFIFLFVSGYFYKKEAEKGIPAVGNQKGGESRAQGKAAVYGQIWKIQNFVCYINSQCKDSVNQSLLQNRYCKAHCIAPHFSNSNLVFADRIVCLYCAVFQIVFHCDSKIFCYFCIQVKSCFCDRLKWHFRCFLFSFENLCCHLTCLFS